VLKWFSRSKRQTGTMAIEIEAGAIKFAHAQHGAAGRPMVIDHGCVECGPEARQSELARLARDKGMAGIDCTTLLDPADYQMLLVESPSVPREELKAAIRWKIKDMVSYPVDDAALDVIEIPPLQGGVDKARSMYAVASPNEAVQKRVELFAAAGARLQVIDIPEMAQRNIASLFEQTEGAVALLAFARWGGLLTVSFRGNLIQARRLEVTSDQLGQKDHQDYYRERVASELSRSLDNFERQFSGMTVGELLLAPFPESDGFDEYLRGSIYVPLRAIDLREALEFAPDAKPDVAEQWRSLFTIGAALRVEERAL
jgi:MSHA biogenesis protein MshI